MPGILIIARIGSLRRHLLFKMVLVTIFFFFFKYMYIYFFKPLTDFLWLPIKADPLEVANKSRLSLPLTATLPFRKSVSVWPPRLGIGKAACQ